MAMRREESAAMLPEPRPDAFAVRLWEWQRVECRPWEKFKPPFTVSGGERLELELHLEQKHQPVRVAFKTVLAYQAG